MDPEIFRDLIIRPTLGALNMGGRAAEDLLLGTALVESGLRHLRQIRGPALGLYQCEPATYADILEYVRARPDILARLRPLIAGSGLPDASQIVWNLKFATAICRLHYWRVPAPIPADRAGQAAYWKRYYNTVHGRGTVAKYLACARFQTEGGPQ
ncbi:hypothetical protein [Sneathiella sp.]|uniref:hypothetical protein n=1 Tax=Sneathiella sp. TaxID=1964365 RepID=UPI002FDF0BB1